MAVASDIPARRRAAFTYRGLTIVPSFADDRSKELDRAMREFGVRIGLLTP